MRGVDLAEARTLFSRAEAIEGQLIVVAIHARKIGNLGAIRLAALKHERVGASASGENVMTAVAYQHVVAVAANQRVVALTTPKRNARVVGPQRCAGVGEDCPDLDVGGDGIIGSQ